MVELRLTHARYSEPIQRDSAETRLSRVAIQPELQELRLELDKRNTHV